MADYSFASEDNQLVLMVRRLLAEAHVARPATVLEFQPGPPQRVTVQPMTRIKVMVEGEARYVDPPVIADVPYFCPYAQTAGLLLTLPVQPGDTVMLFVPDRGLDNALTVKGVSQPPMYADARVASLRAHALTDCFAVSMFTQDMDGVPDYDTGHIELRDRERKNYISLGADGITMTDGSAVMKISGGKITTSAPNGIANDSGAGIANTAQGVISDTTPAVRAISSANFNTGQGGAEGESTITGTLRSTQGTFRDSAGTSLTTHTHPYTDDGAGMNTSAPNSGS